MFMIITAIFVISMLIGAAVQDRENAVVRKRGGALPDRLVLPAGFAKPDRSAGRVRKGLALLRRRDPTFSEVIFLDFACLLYTRLHEARGRGDLGKYVCYAREDCLTDLGRRNAPRGRVVDVRDVIVGSAQIVGVRGLSGKKGAVEIRVRFESNYTDVIESDGDQRPQSFYCEEFWTLRRDRKAVSPYPDEIDRLGCPACGSALEIDAENRCKHCRGYNPSLGGLFTWQIAKIDLANHATRGPMLTGQTEEVGTDLPTIVDPRYRIAREEFETQNPSFSWRRTARRFMHVFRELQEAWSTRDWERARPYETDALFQSHRYWIEEYRRQGLQNVLDDLEIEKMKPVRIDSDAFFDAITVRVWAQCRDYTLDDSGKLVCGHRNRTRRFSEYWTFVRRRGVEENERDSSACPHCGAPLDDVNRAGVCGHCGSKITRGDFDWVLSRIEQDESYNPVATPSSAPRTRKTPTAVATGEEEAAHGHLEA